MARILPTADRLHFDEAMEELDREDVRYRWAEPADAPQVFEILVRAFRIPHGSAKWRQAYRLVEGQTGKFRVLETAARIAGIAYVNPHTLAIGCATIELAYLGQIAIRPELQGHGLGARLIGNLLEALQASGCHLARLSGLVQYYRRFGWVPFPRRYVEFSLENLQAGTAEVRASDVLAPPADTAHHVREYDPVTDHARREELFARFYRHRTGAGWVAATARSSPLTTEPPQRRRLVYECTDKLLGYVATNLLAEDVSGFEAAVHLHEAAFDLDHPEAVTTLTKHVLWTARCRGARRVTARLAWDPHLFAILRHANLVFERIELFNSVTGNMLRIVDFDSLVERILPELSSRWLERGRGGRVAMTLAVEGWSAPLRLDEAGVHREPAERGEVDDPISAANTTKRGARPATSLQLTAYEFIALLLGLWPLEQTLSQMPSDPAAAGILNALFPIQPTASSTWC